MKRETTSITEYDNDVRDGCDGYVGIKARTVVEGMFNTSSTDYTLKVGDMILSINRRELQDVHDLIEEVMNDED